MTRLAILSTAVGAAIIAARLPGVIWPVKFREHAVKFSRSVWWGRVLMGIAAAIAWVVVYRTATDEWAKFRPLIIIGFPVAYWLVITYGNQFLAVRGAAALIMLLAKVLVDAADASDLPARLCVTTLAYVWVIAAIWMAIAPHHIRDAIQFLMANDRRCRCVCGASVALGAGLIGLGLFVY